LLIGLTGCQTNMKKAFEEIQPGMDKGQVLEIIGGPRAVTRFHGKDRWFISFYHQGTLYEREVHFTDGKATYVGAPYEPPVDQSAAAVDKKNQETNDQIFKELTETRGQMGQAAQDYEDKVKGNDKVRYVPEFQPVQ
jgi:outer membrane protein assembly factor BamE